MDSPFLNDRLALAVGSGFYAAGLLYGIWSLLFRRRHSRFAAYSLMALGWLVQTLGLFLRSRGTHACPIGNTFEVLQFVAWSSTLLYLFVGTVFRSALRTHLIDERARFDAPDDRSVLQRLATWVSDRFHDWFSPSPRPQKKTAPPAPAPAKTPTPDADPLQEVIDRIVEESKREEAASKAAGNATPN